MERMSEMKRVTKMKKYKDSGDGKRLTGIEYN